MCERVRVSECVSKRMMRMCLRDLVLQGRSPLARSHWQFRSAPRSSSSSLSWPNLRRARQQLLFVLFRGWKLVQSYPTINCGWQGPPSKGSLSPARTGIFVATHKKMLQRASPALWLSRWTIYRPRALQKERVYKRSYVETLTSERCSMCHKFIYIVHPSDF